MLHILYIIECVSNVSFPWIYLFLTSWIDLFHWRKSLLSVYTHTHIIYAQQETAHFVFTQAESYIRLSVKLLQSQADRKRQGFEETGFKVFSSSRISYKKREAFVLLVTKWHESHTHTHTHYVTMCVLDATILFSPLAEAKSLPDVPTAHNGTFFCRIKPSETLSPLYQTRRPRCSHTVTSCPF